MMNDKRLYKNIGINVILKPLTMLLSMIYIPVLLDYLGDEKYGVWATISAFVNWFSVFDIGIGNGMRNKLAESLAAGDDQKSGEIVATSYAVISVISVCIFGCFWVISLLIDLPTFLNISIAGENVRLAVWITVLFICINFVLSLGNTITYSMQQPALASVCGLFLHILNIIFVLLCRAFRPADMVLISLTLGSSSVIVNGILNIYIFRKYPYLRLQKNKFNRELIHSITSLGILFFCGQISALVMNSTDNILISKLFTASDVTPYSVAYKLFMVFVQLQGVVIMPMWSAFTNAKVQGEYKWICEKFNKMQWIAVVLSVGIFMLFILIEPISRLWLGHAIDYSSNMLFVMAVYFIIYLFSGNYASFLCGIGDVKLYSVMALTSALLNIPLSIMFAKFMNLGLTGIILGTLVSQIPYALLIGWRATYHMKRFRGR
ncbi:MAG: oligosaccharide flippase family protein [Hungatella sp.]|nr:oligosaccharide flippase family protein [Hungatella sp.]